MLDKKKKKKKEIKKKKREITENKKEYKGIIKKDRKTLLLEKTQQSVKLIENQIFEGKIEDGFIHLFHTTREFFAKFFKIRYEFTYEELLNELKKRRGLSLELKEKIKIFSNHLSVIEYSDSTLSKYLLMQTLGEFKYIARIITTGPDKKNIPNKIKTTSKLNKFKEKTLKVLHTLHLYKTEAEKLEAKLIEEEKKKQKQKEKEAKLTSEKQKYVDKIKKLSSEVGLLLGKNKITMAKKSYILLNRLFQTAQHDIKKESYDHVKDAYHRIVTYTSVKPTKEQQKIKQVKPTTLKKIKIDETKINNLILNTYNLIKNNNKKKAKLVYAIGYKLYNRLSLSERKNIYPKLRKLHKELNTN